MLVIVLYVIGITAEGMTGALAAGRERLDLFGVSLIACVTAIGGGTVRDLLLNNYPLTWVEHPIYLVFIVSAAMVAVSMSILMHHFHQVFLLLDALGLSVFVMLGTKAALELGHGVLIAVVSAVVTGIFGGVLRDILTDRIPLVFRSEMYASVAVFGALLYALLEGPLHASDGLSAAVAIVATFIFRLLVIYFQWSLPVFEYQERVYNRDARNRLTQFLQRRSLPLPRPSISPKERTTQGIVKAQQDRIARRRSMRERPLAESDEDHSQKVASTRRFLRVRPPGGPRKRKAEGNPASNPGNQPATNPGDHPATNPGEPREN